MLRFMGTVSPYTNLRPFPKGHKFGKGNPLGGKIEKLRARLIKAVTKEDFDAIAKKLISLAKGGDLQAIKEFFDRTVGKSRLPVDVTHDGTITTISDGEAAADQILDRLRAHFGSDVGAGERN